MRLISLCAAALLGLALGDLGRLGEPPRLLFAAVVAALGTCLAWRHPSWRWLALATCALAAGGLRASMVVNAPPPALAADVGQLVRLGGRLLEPPTLSSSGAAARLVLQVDAVGPSGHDPPPAPPPVRLTVLADPALLASPARADGSTPGPAPARAEGSTPTRAPALAESSTPGPAPALAGGSAPSPAPAFAGGSAPRRARARTADSTTLNPQGFGGSFATLEGQGLADDPAKRQSPEVTAAAAALSPPGGSGNRDTGTRGSGNGGSSNGGSSNGDTGTGGSGNGDSSGSLASFEVGDYLVLEGRLLGGMGGVGGAAPILFFPKVLAHLPPRDDASSPGAWLSNLRSKAAAGIGRYLPEPQASLATGLLLGGSGQLDGDFRGQLQRSGLAHLVAIDGYKQVIVAAALGAVSVRLLGARLATLPVIFGIAGYTFLTGAHPSAVRAALMVGLASVAALTGRVADPLTSLLLASLAMAAVDPPVLLDVGLQLSLSATLGIVLLWPRLRRRLRGIPSFVAEPAGLTLAVTLATLPVMLSVFQSVSLISPVAHILAVPLLPLALASTALLAAVSSMAALANVVAWLAWLPSTLLVEIIRVCGSLPGAALSTGQLPLQAALALAATLLLWGLWGLPEAEGLRQRWAGLHLSTRGWAVPAASVCASLATVALFQLVRPDGQLHVQTLSAGQGQAVFIRGPTGRTALVVAGRVGAAMLAGQVADQLAVWEHKLGTVLQLDAAAEPGLGLTLARYPADQRVIAAQDGRIDLGGGATLDVYAPTPDDPAPRVALSYGLAWVPLFGHPPPPAADATNLASEHELRI